MGRYFIFVFGSWVIAQDARLPSTSAWDGLQGESWTPAGGTSIVDVLGHFEVGSSCMADASCGDWHLGLGQVGKSPVEVCFRCGHHWSCWSSSSAGSWDGSLCWVGKLGAFCQGFTASAYNKVHQSRACHFGYKWFWDAKDGCQCNDEDSACRSIGAQSWSWGVCQDGDRISQKEWRQGKHSGNWRCVRVDKSSFGDARAFWCSRVSGLEERCPEKGTCSKDSSMAAVEERSWWCAWSMLIIFLSFFTWLCFWPVLPMSLKCQSLTVSPFLSRLDMDNGVDLSLDTYLICPSPYPQ